jgi:hypothetical protein
VAVDGKAAIREVHGNRIQTHAKKTNNNTCRKETAKWNKNVINKTVHGSYKSVTASANKISYAKRNRTDKLRRPHAKLLNKAIPKLSAFAARLSQFS